MNERKTINSGTWNRMPRGGASEANNVERRTLTNQIAYVAFKHGVEMALTDDENALSFKRGGRQFLVRHAPGPVLTN